MPVTNTTAKVARRAAMTGRRRRNQPLEVSGWIRGVVLVGLTGSGGTGGLGRSDGVAEATQVFDERHRVTCIHIGTEPHKSVGYGPVGHGYGLSAGIGEVVYDSAAVSRIAVAFHESSLTEPVHQGGDRRSADRQSISEVRRGGATFIEEHQHPVLGEAEFVFGQGDGDLARQLGRRSRCRYLLEPGLIDRKVAHDG